MILLRPICWLLGHRRGQRSADDDTEVDFGRITTHLAYRCPRCDRLTRYKVKSKPPVRSSPSDGSAHYQEHTA